MLFEVLLFLLLQPGVLLTLPPVGKNVFMSCKTSVPAVILHAILFAIILYLVKLYVPKVYRIGEGFQSHNSSPNCIWLNLGTYILNNTVGDTNVMNSGPDGTFYVGRSNNAGTAWNVGITGSNSVSFYITKKNSTGVDNSKLIPLQDLNATPKPPYNLIYFRIQKPCTNATLIIRVDNVYDGGRMRAPNIMWLLYNRPTPGTATYSTANPIIGTADGSPTFCDTYNISVAYCNFTASDFKSLPNALRNK